MAWSCWEAREPLHRKNLMQRLTIWHFLHTVWASTAAFMRRHRPKNIPQPRRLPLRIIWHIAAHLLSLSKISFGICNYQKINQHTAACSYLLRSRTTCTHISAINTPHWRETIFHTRRISLSLRSAAWWSSQTRSYMNWSEPPKKQLPNTGGKCLNAAMKHMIQKALQLILPEWSQ